MRTQLAILLLLAGSTASVGAGELPWTRAEFKARKMFMTIRLDMELDLLSGEAMEEATPAAFESQGIAASGDQAALVTLRSKRSDQIKETYLYLDPLNGAALRRRQRERSSKPDVKDLRYTETGIARTRSEPLKGERDKPPAEWSQVREQFRAYPELPEGAVVSDTAALPFLLSTRDWQEPGENFELLVFEDRQLVRVTATAVRWNRTRVDFRTAHGDVDGKQRLLEVRVIASALDNAGKADVDLFGLSSDVLLLLDTELGVPVEIRGSVPFLGEVRFTLKQVRQSPATH